MFTIKREDTRPDRLRKYKVVLDNHEIGQIGNGEEKSFESTVGTHELMLKIDWARSNTVQFVSDSGSTAFTRKSNVTGIKFFSQFPTQRLCVTTI